MINPIFADIQDKHRIDPPVRAEYMQEKIEQFQNKETERFKKLDTLLSNAQNQKDKANNRLLYRFWSLEILALIETFTAKSAPNDNANGIALSFESKERIKRLRRFQRSI